MEVHDPKEPEHLGKLLVGGLSIDSLREHFEKLDTLTGYIVMSDPPNEMFQGLCFVMYSCVER